MEGKRYRPGCIWRRGNVWYIRFGKDPAIRLGTTQELPTKTKVRQAAEPIILKANKQDGLPTVSMAKVIAQYKLKEMPRRASTAACYTSWLDNCIEPRWGKTELSEFGNPPEVVGDWIKSLPIGTKSKREVRNVLNQLMRSAVLWGWMKESDRPALGSIKLRRQKGEKVRKARVLPLPEFRAMVKKLDEPFRTMASVQYVNGLRVSELFGLKWENIDWLGKQFDIRNSVVGQIEDQTKTPESEATQPLTDQELAMLKAWRGSSEFTEPHHYVFASPYSAGELPFSYTGYKQRLWKACDEAEIARITPHSFRHSLRAWLKKRGESAEMTTEAMRHADFNQSRQYGADGTVSETLRRLHQQFVDEALNIT